MKKILKIAFFILSSFLFLIKVSAADTCTYQQKANLNEIAGKIKISYEVETREHTVKQVEVETMEEIDVVLEYDVFKISIYNMTEDVYIIYTNNFESREELVIVDPEKGGVYTFENDNFENIINYTFDVYSSLDECPGIKLKTYNFTKPKRNIHAGLQYCYGFEDNPYCKKYITEEITATDDEISETTIGSVKTKIIPKEEIKKLLEFFKDNYIYFIIGAVIIIGATTTAIIFSKKRRTLWKKK